MNSSNDNKNNKDGFELNATGLSDWQKELIDERLADYTKNPSSVISFSETLDDIEKTLTQKSAR